MVSHQRDNGGGNGITKRKTMIGHLPRHLLAEILLRLPVKSLLRCKCIRRSWRRVVDDALRSPVYAAEFLERSSARPALLVRTPRSLRRARGKIAKGLGAMCKPRDTLFLGPFIDRFGPAFVKHFNGSPSCCYTYECDGIVCLYNLEHSSTVVLMNPTLGRFEVLNRSWWGSSSIKIKRQYFGFGVDVVDNVHKLVRIVFGGGGGGGDNLAEICTFDTKRKTMVWRKIGGRTDFMWCGSPRQDQQVSCNGVYYWFGANGEDQWTRKPILSFDMHSETFQSIPWPAFDEPAPPYATRCSLLVWRNERVVLLRYCKVGTRPIDAKATPSPIDLWAFEERGWSKFLTVPPLDYVYYPLAFWNNDELILKSFSYSSEGDHFASYNILTKTYTRLPGISELEGQIYVSRYVQSLFWIN